MSIFVLLIFFASLNDICDCCEVGYYGETCSVNCPILCHNNVCDVTSGKCVSCVKGYYRDYKQDCYPCPEHCEHCDSYNFCLSCKNGFKGEVCDDVCDSCKPDTSCDKNSGYCFENCNEGLSGELCNIPCDSKCKSCNRHNKDECIYCADDEHGKACKEECFNKCLRNTCNKSQESCAYGCLSGHMSDKTCNRTCLLFCKDRVCNITCKELKLTETPSSSTSKANIGLILGLVLVCVTGAGIILFILIRRRRTKRRNGYMTSDRTPKTDGSNVHLFVQGLNPRTRPESIQTYIEDIGGYVTVKDEILFNPNHTEALVTLQQRPDMMKLMRHVRARKLDKSDLKICEMPPPRAIVVSGDGISNRDVIEYFKHESNGGGPLKKNDQEETDDGCYLLEFEDPVVVPRLFLSKTHRVDGVPLKVSPYYKCENGAIWDINLHAVQEPDPVKISIPSDQLNIVTIYCKDKFTACLQDKHADITFFKDHVVVKPLTNLGRALVRRWKTGIQEAVKNFLDEHIVQSNIEVPEQIWDNLMKFIKSYKSECKGLLIQPDYGERRAINLVGYKGVVDGARVTIADKIELLSREARRTTETRKLQSAQKLTILEIQGTFSAIEKKYGDMQLHVSGNEVTIKGDPADIANAFMEISSECDKIKPVEYKHLKGSEWVIFVKEEQTVKCLQKKLEQERLFGSWEINETTLNIFVPDKGDSLKIKNTLLETVLEKSVPIDKSLTGLLTSDKWTNLLLENQRLYKDKVKVYKTEKEVVIIGTNDVVPKVKELIEKVLYEKTKAIPCKPAKIKFISEFWTQDNFEEIQKNEVMIIAKANEIELRGLPAKLNKCEEELKKKIQQITFKEYSLKETGKLTVMKAAKHFGTIGAIEKECKCVIELPQDFGTVMLTDYEVIDTEILNENLQNSSSNASPDYFKTRRHKIKIQLTEKDSYQKVKSLKQLYDLSKADIIVVGAESNFIQRSGTDSYSLPKQNDPQLQTDCNKLNSYGMKSGEVAVIDTGTPNFDKLYLTTLSSWKEAGWNGVKVFRNIMRECLRLADKYDKKTISFSSTGTGGYLGYPGDMAATIMYGAAVEFDDIYISTSLKEINIVIDKEDHETIKAFKNHEHMRIYGACSVGALSTDFVDGRIKIELVTEALTTQKVDAILCSVLSDMDLTESDIFKSLVQKGGVSLQDECKQIYDKKLDVGKVKVISAGNLPCKTVFLTVEPKFTDSNSAEQFLITTLQTTFQLATKDYKSLAIPVLNTGSFIDLKTAAKCMYETVIEWAHKNHKTSLKVVRFVMYGEESENQLQAYRACHLKTQARETRDKRNFIGNQTILINPDKDFNYKMVKDGCVIDKIRLEVQVGDLLSNSADAIVIEVGADFEIKGEIAQDLAKKFPNILAEIQQKRKNKNLKNDEVVITGGAGLKAMYLIHVLFQDSLADWRSKIVACLEEADKNSITSVAFSVLGSGARSITLQASGIGECMFAAIDDFTSQNPKSGVKGVKLIVHDSNAGYIPAIIAALQARTTDVNSQWGIGKLLKSQLGFVAEKLGFGKQEAAETKPQSMPSKGSSGNACIHSDATSNIDCCIKALDDMIGLEFATKVVDLDMDVVKDKQKINNIVDSDILLDIDVKVTQKVGKCYITGPLRKDLAAATCIYNTMRQHKWEKENQNSAKVWYDQCKWHWMREEGVLSEKEVPYDIMPNFIIENAYREGKQTVELKSKDGKIYVIDFQKLVEYPKANMYDTVMVMRKDILRGIQIVFPKKWVDKGKDKNDTRVTLDSGEEYEEVKKRFLGEIGKNPNASESKIVRSVQVIQIERIQNRSLYQQYAAKKKLMEQQMSGSKEIDLWHETAEESIPRIINYGFNRSYCGVQDITYGHGVYFAAKAVYSAKSCLAGKKPGATKYMFLAKAVTGNLIKGTPSMRVLPIVDPAHPNVMYYSAVDDVNNPKQFVIFHDKQAYPEYLITYTT